MQFLKQAEAESWCVERGISTDPRGPIARPASISVPLTQINWARLTWLSSFVASQLEPFDECLLWVTAWGIWPSSENLHLYYKLRGAYGEIRRLHEAPGHLFLKHEGADLATFVEVSLLFGWDFHLVPNTLIVSAFVSHDEFLSLHFSQADAINAAKQALSEAKLVIAS